MRKKGFTLVELMMALGIFMTFSIFMYRFFADEQKSLIAKNLQLDMYYNGAAALNYMESMVRKNPHLDYDDTDDIFYEDATEVKAVFDPMGSGTNAELYVDKASRALKDSDNNTLCSYIDSINLTLQDNGLIAIDIELSCGSGWGKLQHSVKTTINIEK